MLLQNCHLGLNFMDELLETVTTADSSHEGFSVWITTEAHNQFPISLLQVRRVVYQLCRTVESRCYKHPNVTLSPVFQYSDVFFLKQNALLHTNYFYCKLFSREETVGNCCCTDF